MEAVGYPATDNDKKWDIRVDIITWKVESFELKYRRAEIIGLVDALARRKPRPIELFVSLSVALLLRLARIAISLLCAFALVYRFGVPPGDTPQNRGSLNSFLAIGFLGVLWIWEALSFLDVPAKRMLTKAFKVFNPILSLIFWMAVFSIFPNASKGIWMVLSIILILMSGCFGRIFPEKWTKTPFYRLIERGENR